MRVLTMLAAVAVVAGCKYNSTGNQSSDATLASLSTSAGALTPAFSSGVTAYAMTVPNTTTQITVTATASNIYATLRVKNAIITSGQASPAIALDPGANLVDVSVVAEDGTIRIYDITVTRS